MEPAEPDPWEEAGKGAGDNQPEDVQGDGFQLSKSIAYPACLFTADSEDDRCNTGVRQEPGRIDQCSLCISNGDQPDDCDEVQYLRERERKQQ